MNSSPVPSTSKCISSDFSIERILSDEPRSSSNHSADVPDWLCCTRYRPPRLPRSGNSGGCRSRRSGRHARVPFTAAQAAALEAAYSRAPYLAPPALRALAAALQLRDDRIKIWFQNRRARERREKCANIAPPPAVTLPPTTTEHSALIAGNQWLNNKTIRSLSNHRLFIPIADKNEDSMSSSDSTRDSATTIPMFRDLFSSENRSETPLDIETIED